MTCGSVGVGGKGHVGGGKGPGRAVRWSFEVVVVHVVGGVEVIGVPGRRHGGKWIDASSAGKELGRKEWMGRCSGVGLWILGLRTGKWTAGKGLLI